MDGHIIDPTYFYDAVEEFAFNYVIYHKYEGDSIDEYGRATPNYKKDIIRGSFQTQGTSVKRDVKGNTMSEEVNFYCTSLYRIHENDIIERNGNYYLCGSTHNYDEWGVREASLTMKQLYELRDFEEWLKYQTGGSIV